MSKIRIYIIYITLAYIRVSFSNTPLPIIPNSISSEEMAEINKTKSIAHQSNNELSSPRFVIIIPSYNNAKWYSSNLQSVIDQNYEGYRIIYINDCSKDDTWNVVEEFLQINKVDYQSFYLNTSNSQDIAKLAAKFAKYANKQKKFFTLVNNSHRTGALANLYRAILSCDEDEIIVTVDGDDWLPYPNVLSDLSNLYTSREIWLTHGRFIEYPHNGSSWSLPIPQNVVQKNAFREFRLPSHLRTFYTWLFKKIDLQDLLYKGDFCPMAWDMAMMFPMIEMAGERHTFSNTINYVYNMANQLNDNKVDPQLQRDIDAHIRKLPPYTRLENRFSEVHKIDGADVISDVFDCNTTLKPEKPKSNTKH